MIIEDCSIPVVSDSELAALANYHGCMDAAEHCEAHDRLYANMDAVQRYLRQIGAKHMNENTYHDGYTENVIHKQDN